MFMNLLYLHLSQLTMKLFSVLNVTNALKERSLSSHNFHSVMVSFIVLVGNIILLIYLLEKMLFCNHLIITQDDIQQTFQNHEEFDQRMPVWGRVSSVNITQKNDFKSEFCSFPLWVLTQKQQVENPIISRDS